MAAEVGRLSANEVAAAGEGSVFGGMVPVREAWRCFGASVEGGGQSAFMEQARGMWGSAQLPCFVIAVHCAASLSNIKLPVLCAHMQDLPWTCSPEMHNPA